MRAKPIYADLWKTLLTVTLADGIWPLLDQPAKRGEMTKRVWRILAAENIRRRHWYFSHDGKTGRCFNNVANFPRELRQFLLLGGHPTAECDIANSQPLFLANLAYGLTPSEERLRYANLVRSGRFYETLGQWAGLGGLDREKLKKRVYSGILFGRDHHRSVLWDALKPHFPQLLAYIDESKREAHNGLALKLQSKEAEVMLGRIIPRLKAEGIRALSIHDGCLCRAADASWAKLVMEEEVEAAIGIKPTVKIKVPEPALPLCTLPPVCQLNLTNGFGGQPAVQWQ